MAASRKTPVIQWARELMRAPEQVVILDTETTGLKVGEIVSISLLRGDGTILLDTLVKPSRSIPADATRIHGITDEMLTDQPTWNRVQLQVIDLLRDKDVVVYNAVYDRSMMHQSGERWGLEHVPWKEISRWHCAMEQYAIFYGDWNDYHHSYRWQKLTQACEQQGIPEPDAPAHSALGDCLRTLALMQFLAAQ